MAKKKYNKTTPLREEEDDLNIDDDLNVDDDLTDDNLETGTDTKKTDTDDIFDDSATFLADKTLGVTASAIQPKTVDTSATDKYLAEIEKPASESVYDKMAARYRSQGEGAVLRTQKNLANLFQPTITLIKEREAAASARFTLLKEKMPEFDESTIFGDQSGNPMPIVDEVKNISSTVKDDLRALSRLNPNDDRYDEIRKRVEKNQDIIVKFDQINKKLLEIRNAGTDESQWSAGMDPVTANMWRDIYTSNGQNIKIQDGKLVWTDTRGETKYYFKDISDVGPKLDALGNTDTDLGMLHFQTTNDSKQSDRKFFEKETHPDDIKDIQTALNNLGFTDDDGNKLKVDGDFGDNTEEAYKKYLKNKDRLEKEWFDENLPEDSEYRKTTGVGETKTIDLSAIGDGPTMIDNEATNLDRVIKGEVQKFIEMDGTIDDPMYNSMIKAKLFELNKLSPQGIKSLIFDGMNTDDDDLFTGSNTNSFLEGVVRNHYGEDLSAQEIAEKIDLMRSGDVTQQYKDENGELKTLRSQYMKWYKGEIDGMIEGGKKSKVVQSSITNTNTRTSSGGGGGEITQFTDGRYDLLSSLQNSGAQLTYGARGKSSFVNATETRFGGNIDAGEIYLTGADMQSIVQNDPEESLDNFTFTDHDYKLTNNNELQYWDKDKEEWVASDNNKGVTNARRNRAYRLLLEYINTQSNLASRTDQEDFKNITRKKFYSNKDGYNFDFSIIKKKNLYIKENADHAHGSATLDGYLLDYRDDDFVAGTLNRMFGNIGFTFTDAGKDKIKVKNDRTGATYTFRTNRGALWGLGTGYDDRRREDEDGLVKWLNNEYNNTYKSEFNSKTWVRGDQKGEDITAVYNDKTDTWVEIKVK